MEPTSGPVPLSGSLSRETLQVLWALLRNPRAYDLTLENAQAFVKAAAELSQFQEAELSQFREEPSKEEIIQKEEDDARPGT